MKKIIIDIFMALILIITIFTLFMAIPLYSITQGIQIEDQANKHCDYYIKLNNGIYECFKGASSFHMTYECEGIIPSCKIKFLGAVRD